MKKCCENCRYSHMSPPKMPGSIKKDLFEYWDLGGRLLPLSNRRCGLMANIPIKDTDKCMYYGRKTDG